MLSLRRNIDRLDQQDRKFTSALAAFLKTVSVLRDLPLPAEPKASREYRAALQEVEIKVGDGRNADVVDQSSESVRILVKNFCAELGAASAKKEEDVRVLIEAVAEASEILGGQHSGQADRLSSFTIRLQGMEKVSDLGMMRRLVVNHVRDLKTIAEQAKRENESALMILQKEVAEFRERLDNAERRASHDALTGLLNRGEGEERLNKMIEKGGEITAILVDLNGFKKINDTWGHAAGDQILKVCGKVLTSCTRFGDLVCRWGGDEFLVVLECDETTARLCAARIEKQLREPRTVVVMGEIHEVPSSGSLGIAKHRAGESAHDIVARADAEMYRDKNSSRVPALAMQ